MIEFLRNWVEQIAITIIIVSIFELILPDGKLKKYIKIILGVYVVFCIISPFVDNSLYSFDKLDEIDLGDYAENAISTENTTVNQESMDLRLQELYIQELENNIEAQVQEYGYNMSKCDIDADLSSSSENPGIHAIKLELQEKGKISNIESVEINISRNSNIEEAQNNDQKTAELKKSLAEYYEIDEDIIKISIK